MLKQAIEIRKSYTVDEGTMGFHDYVLKYENLEDFVNRVTQKYSRPDISVVNISYPDSTKAIVAYRLNNTDKQS